MTHHTLRSRRLAGAVLGVVIALVLSGCTFIPIPHAGSHSTTVTSTPVPKTSSGVPAQELRFYEQNIVWHSCDSGFQCATAIAPLSWSDPGGQTIKLALIRKPASGTPIGSLFVNPGGPGASAVDFVQDAVGAMDRTVQEHYNVVGFDPPGVGHSTAVKCYDDTQLTNYLYDITPGVRGSAQWIAAEKQETTALGAACLKNTGALLGHVDTASAARDMDMLRNALGDAKLNYYGFSYGTLLGSIYASLFPKRIGHMVLDGVVDPAQTWDQSNVEQAEGFENNLKAYMQWCLGGTDSSCPFQGTVDQGMQSVADLLAKVDAKPIRNSDGRMLGANTLVTAIITPLYSSNEWSYLDQLFSSVSAGSASIAFALADSYNDRNSNGSYADNLMVAFQSINCLDYPMNESPSDLAANAAAINKVAPVFGPYFSYGGLACAGWPYKAVRTPAPVTAAGSAPILVVGTTNDPATPYTDAVHLAKELQNGHLVTWHGNGHTAYGRSNSCVTNTVDDYLVHSTVPAQDPEC